MKLLIKEHFPNLKVKTTKGEINLPDDFKGKWFVLFSHPADFTPVCTTEFVSFQKHKAAFDELGAELIGLSVDNLDSHFKWIDWIKENLGVEVQFPIIDDEDRKISERLGLIHPGAGDTDTVRAVIIVDHKGNVRAMLEYPKEIGRNIDEIVRMVKTMKMASIDKVFAPANWPNNEIIKDKVLFKPAPDEKLEEGAVKLSDWFIYKEYKK